MRKRTIGVVAVFLGLGLGLGIGAFSAPPAPRAERFLPYGALEGRQRELLGGPRLVIGGESEWEEWTRTQDGVAAAFLAITRALGLTEVTLSDGRPLRALDLVESVTEFRGDRIYARMHRELFEDWIRSGARFRFLSEDGQEEEAGRVAFNAGDIGGSLHPGYDVQGYTSRSKVPRVQWNYRYADAAADIDLDGYAPLKFGWIPNPQHLTWENSDPRFWLPEFIKKFGEPGFAVATP